MPDRLFSNSKLAALYDLFSPSENRDDFRFYLPMIMTADSALDVGCGTGSLLIKARDAGHHGRLCGLDPAVGMLEQARKRPDIEWKHGDLSSVSWHREFDLAVMSGHAFQAFLSDEEILASMKAIRESLKDGGRFAFETRNPLDRAWERWGVEYGVEAIDTDGSPVTMSTEVERPVEGQFVRFSHTFTSPRWPQSEGSESELRFIDLDSLNELLAEAGFVIEDQYGDWDKSPITKTSPEIVTIARQE